MMRQVFMIFGVLALLFVAACAQTDRTVEPRGNTTTEGTQCTDPRPEACTREYMPVCGDNGQTYGNKCEACSDTAVDSYEQGACSEDGALFTVRYAGAFTAPEWAQTIYTVKDNTFTATRMTNENEVTYTQSRELSAEELGELQDILAGINNLEATYYLETPPTDVGYADIVVGDESTRVTSNIEEAYPANLLALRNWIHKQAAMLPDEQGRIYQSRDPDVCMRIRYMCVEGMQAFSDDTGCGCEPSNPAGGTHLALTQCTDPRPEACTMQYDPVCAQVDTGVRCVTTPCPSTVYKTMGNSCSACSDEKVYGYFPGECGDLEGKSPEDLASA